MADLGRVRDLTTGYTNSVQVVVNSSNQLPP